MLFPPYTTTKEDRLKELEIRRKRQGGIRFEGGDVCVPAELLDAALNVLESIATYSKDGEAAEYHKNLLEELWLYASYSEDSRGQVISLADWNAGDN